MQNKIFKRSVSILLLMSILFCRLPLNLVFANLQNHITNLSLQYVLSTNDYNLNFSWNNPEPSDNADGSYTSKDSPSGFKIEGRNATNKETNWTNYSTLKGSDITSASINTPLQSGSIYEFRVTPYHYHSSQNGSVVANYDQTTSQETFLFMTDLEVEAKGSGNTLTITFDNPTYMGQNIFENYKVYYQRGSSDITSFNKYKILSVEDAEVITQDTSRNGVQRLTFTITDSGISQGEVYSIKVEPMYQGSEVRETKSVNYKTIYIDSTYKKITFKSTSEKEYRVDNISINIPLTVQEDGKDYLKLNWTGLSNTNGAIEKIEIYSGDEEDEISKLIGTIYSSEAVYINSFRIERPETTTYYKILVYIEDFESPIQSEIAVYIPGAVNITPNMPSLYLYDTIINNEYALDIYWDVFLRYPYTSEEEALQDADGKYIDTNVTYDLWITDNISNLSNSNLPKTLNSVSATEFNKNTIEDTSTPVYNYKALEYYTILDNGDIVSKAIEGNKTYYVKIIAKKPVEGSVPLSSNENIAQIYISINTDISSPQHISKPPLKIKTDEEGKEEITKDSITIEWRTTWFEVFDENTDSWYTNVAIRNGNLIFGENITETDTLVNFYDKYNEELVRKAFVESGLSEEESESLIIRYIDLTSSQIKYDLQIVELTNVKEQGGYEEYLNKILNDEENSNWISIEPKITGFVAEYTLDNLSSNTLYAILLKPYRIVGNNSKDAYPTYILGTTLPEEVEIVVTPITPNLFEKTHDDVSITVKWPSQGNKIVYELAINETNLTDPSQADIIIPYSSISENYFETEENEIAYINYKIENLFPETGYYIWVRAFYPNSDVSSEWSSYLYVKTDSLIAPEAPSGFGLASVTNIDYYNSHNNTSYIQADEDYIIVEWLRDTNDIGSYNTNVSNENAEVLEGSSDINSYMVMFKNLVANKYYYFRAKTKLTVTKTSSSNISKYYSYIIEASLNEDFTDSITIEVPNVSTSGAYKTLTLYSEWTEVYFFKTTFTKDNSEYDGNVNDSLYPLPIEDFEIIYTSDTETLTYRLRSNKTDANGDDDNLVDQRFISKLLQNKVYDYYLDLTNYNGYPITNRVFEMPYSIFKAFEERKINLHLIAGNTTFVLTPSFLDVPEVKNLGYDSTIKISLEQSLLELPILPSGQTYGTTPQKISISVVNSTNKTDILYTGSEIEVILKLKNNYLATATNVSPYIQDNNTTYLQRISGSYNKDTNSFTLKTKKLATYTTIAINTPNVTTSNNQTLYNFNNKIYINDISNLDLTKEISVLQFNNLVSAVANGKTETSINTALDSNDYTSLKRANLLLEGSVVSMEQGVNVLVKLYEIKTKTSYQNYTTIETTKFKDIVNSAYQSSLLKASELGFFGENTTTRPKSTMTIEEALYMLNIILEDSGL